VIGEVEAGNSALRTHRHLLRADGASGATGYQSWIRLALGSREGRVEIMKWDSKEKQIGARVRVHQKPCTRPHLQGMVGRIEHRYGVAGCATLEVWFPQGQIELFGEHDLVKAG
jgi:hypothetical protein